MDTTQHINRISRGFYSKEMSIRKQDVLFGTILAVVAYAVLFSATSTVATTVYAQSTPLFSVTLLAPTSNPVRAEYASIIAQSFRSVGINAQVIYVTFDQLIPRLFFTNAYFPNGSVNWSQVGLTFSQGGYDLGFIGWGATSPVPDSSFSNYRGDYADWAPNGNNYYFYNNSQVNEDLRIADTTLNQTQAVQALWNAEALIKQDNPSAIIYYSDNVIARDSSIKDYGNASAWSSLTFPDIQHYSTTSPTFTFAEAGSVFPTNNVNPLPTTSSNSFYSLFIYSPAFEGLQELSTVPNAQGTYEYYLALATGITHSSNGLDWTVNFRPHTFQDGVPVTADDYVFTYLVDFTPASNSVHLGSALAQWGNYGTFTFSSPAIAQQVAASLGLSNNVSGSTITVDQSNGGPKQTFSVSYVNSTAFDFNLTVPYAYFKDVWLSAAALPLHFLTSWPVGQWNSITYSTMSGPDTYGPLANGAAGFAGHKSGDTVVADDPGGSWNGQPIDGPFGDGPYIPTNFDTTTNTATLVQYNNYWNASGLRALGEFTIKTYNVVWINGATSAIAALKSGQVNQLDTNYGLAIYIPQLKSIPGVSVLISPGWGYQEMGMNLMHPIFGTGVDTPNGKIHPANASQYASDVREAFSLLIPRQYIVSQLLAGLGSPGATPWAPYYVIWYNPNVKPDPYDPTLAQSYLNAAGYPTGTPLPNSSGQGGVTPPPAAVIQTTLQPITISGTFTVNGAPDVGANVTLQYSYDYGLAQAIGQEILADNSSSVYNVNTVANWINYASVLTSSTGSYNFTFVPPYPGPVWVRIAGAPTHSTYTSPVEYQTTYGTLNLATYLSNALAGYATSAQVSNVQSSISSVNSTIAHLSAQVSDLQSSLNTANYVAYGSIVIAIIAIIIAIVATRRK